MKKEEILSEIHGIHQYHDQYGDCKGKNCPTCKVLNRIEELFKEETKPEKAVRQNDNK